ncbi:MAG: hypothetical protein L3J93_05905, partial [Thermoplasmata archaeon]|nr:hypothetical protein [Thermoplasmata archaeon]
EADSLTGRRADTVAARRPSLSFREFLAGRYGSVDALAEAWGLGTENGPPRFDAWGAVPLSPGRAGWTKLAGARRDIADWQGASRPRDHSDRGGYPAIVRLVRDTRQPVILTVNDARELFDHAGALRSLVVQIRIDPVAPPELIHLLEATARAEHLRLAPGAIDAIVRRARGDVRAALNDLEAIGPLPTGPLQLSLLATRDSTAEIADLTGAVLAEPRFYRASEIRDRADADPEDLWPWMEENVPRFARTPLAVENGILRVAQAQIHLARARRQRVWSLWSYGSEIATGGASLAIASAGGAGQQPVAFPEFLAGMGQSRFRRALRDSILAKAGAAFHLSKRKGVESTLPLLEILVSGRTPARKRRDSGTAQDLVRELGLSEEEVEYLGGSPNRTEVEAESGSPPETAPDPPAATIAPPPEPARPVQTRLGQFDR